MSFKVIILFLILSLTSSSLSSTSNYLNIKPDFDYEKYSINSNKHKIPTLENLFQKTLLYFLNKTEHRPKWNTS